MSRRGSPAGSSLTVIIIFLVDENGTSVSRGYVFMASSRQIPALAAATTSGASDELPIGTHIGAPVSLSSCCKLVLLHNTADSNVVRTGTDTDGALIWLTPSRRMSPVVGLKPVPVMSYTTESLHILTAVILPSVSVPVFSQLADEDVFVRHVGCARGQTDRDHHRETLRYSTDSEGDGDHDHIKCDRPFRVLRVCVTAHHANNKDDHTHSQHDCAHEHTQFVQTFLQRGHLRVVLVHKAAPAVGTLGTVRSTSLHCDGRGGEHHVVSRQLLAAAHVGVVFLEHILGLARQDHLIDLEVRAVDETDVGRHNVTSRQHDNISGDELLARDLDLAAAVTQYDALRRRHLLQRLEGVAGIALLDRGNDGVQRHDGDDGQAFHVLLQGDGGQGRSHQQTDDHVGKLQQEDDVHGGPLLCLQRVGAVLGQPLLGVLVFRPSLASTSKPSRIVATGFSCQAHWSSR
ncbi:hypothetical protein GQ600_11004 [Phytophthora cactorum]|nr:hypothetical protein GQ600_11004 [Phytophthora cactorum]